MSYGLNVEMHKQTEICKRLDAIIRQVLPFLSAEVIFCKLYKKFYSKHFLYILKKRILIENLRVLMTLSFLQHQTQVAMAVDRAKQITMAELNAVMQVSVR